MFSILLIEDDHAISEMLRGFLISKNYKVTSAPDGKTGLDALQNEKHDLILLDWMLPDTSGPEIIKIIRKDQVQKEIPILMLTARAEEVDKIKGLDTGADDYMTKPVSLKEMDSRIKALLRRTQGLNVDKKIIRGDLSIDPENNELIIKESAVKIAQTEFRLLLYLMQKSERLHTRSQLLDQVWGQGTFIDERTVDVHILRLRKVLKPHGADKMIKTVRGAGYRFTENLDSNS